MRKKLSPILVTGGAGFIGSEFVRLAAGRGYKIIIVDRLTYAGDMRRLGGLSGKAAFHKLDIRSRPGLERIFREESPRVIVNFAAQTHVDRSIRNSSPFIDTNVKGAQVLLDVSRKHGIDKFVHVSTDEVYGEIKTGRFREGSAIKPNSPYSASKAAADLLICACVRTYGFPAVIVRPCNTYGPWQYPEKLIPLAILKLLKNEKVPVYGDGRNVREWLFVSDCAKAVFAVMDKGKPGEIYNAGSGMEKMNIEVVGQLLNLLGKPAGMIEFVEDRKGHDRRYSLDSQKLQAETGWRPSVDFNKGLQATVKWALKHHGWLRGKWAEVAPLYRRLK